MIDRRAFLQDATAAAAALTLPPFVRTQQSELAPIFAQIERRHDESVQLILNRLERLRVLERGVR